ncbi:MAG TPA: HAD family hydrolase [Dehalococcoidia bacterium]|nr:HAD family hydrolase [Dehalococcoidia bacterium]
MSTHPPVKAVCFDFQDTLAYYPDGNYSVYVRAAAEFGITTTQDALRTLSLDDAWARWRTAEGFVEHAAESEEAWRPIHAGVHADRLAAIGVDAALTAQIADRVVEMQTEPGEYALFDDTIPALQRLGSSGVQSIIVSNHIWRLPEIVRALGIGSMLEGVVTSARIGYRKPHPEVYATAVRLAGCAPSEVLFVGDNPSHDVDGPIAAGMRTALLDRDGSDGRADAIRTLLDVPLA